MSDFKNFAVWGAGNMGGAIVAELLALKSLGRVSSVAVLTRAVSHLSAEKDSAHAATQESKDNAKNTEFAAKGAQIVPYDVTGADPVAALRGVDVLIATAGGLAGHSLQPALLRAAHAAGVRLYVPAEWGDIPDGRTGQPFESMNALHAQAAELGLPIATFNNGPYGLPWLVMVGSAC
jgi:threonine dehydrogenase-like Zn-dependent dehydrogenase